MWWLLLGAFSIAAVNSKPQGYLFDPSKPNVENRITILPYYGGVKGQSLKITETSNGTVVTEIIKTPDKVGEEEEIDLMELEYPQLPSKYEKKFTDYVKTINTNTLNILTLQEKLKISGKLSEKEEQQYQGHMDRITEAADELARLQENNSNLKFENREGLSAWFERKNKLRAEKSKNKTKSEEIEDKQGKWWNKTEEKQKEKEGEEPTENPNDTVEVNQPPDDASVAEANPIGLAVAGEGGVAASKPVATAVVGPGGLAVARPIATAIAGVAPDQALVPIYAEGYAGGNKPKRNGSHKVKQGEAGVYLKKIISRYHTVPDA